MPIIRALSGLLFPISNGRNTIMEFTFPAEGRWVLQGGVRIAPSDYTIDNNLSEAHVCLSASQFLEGPPTGAPDAGHIPYINRQDQLVNTGMAIWDVPYESTGYLILNATFTNSMRALGWVNGFMIPTD